MNKKNQEISKMVWTYKNAKNTTAEKFLIVNEYSIDDKTTLETGNVRWGMENEKMQTIEYSGSDKGSEIVHKASMEALKSDFIIESLDDGTKTFIADEDALIEADEEFWSNNN